MTHQKDIAVAILTVLLVLNLTASAEVRLPAIFGDHMVLQQNTGLKLWGWAEPGENITVSGSWFKKSITTLANTRGEWQVMMPKSEAGGPQTLKIAAKNTITMTDILFGEVWLCSGQSNMEMPVDSLPGWATGVINFRTEIIAANFPKIRIVNLKNKTADAPQADCELELSWRACQPQTIDSFSAVAYFFGRELFSNLNIPIGLIESDWGGSPAEAWMSRAALTTEPDFAAYLAPDYRPSWAHHQPSGLYNAMIYPLSQYAIRGVIWYQGESNTKDPIQYRKLFPALIRNWRADWDQDLPFYFVQIAPYNYEEPLVAALLREAQLMTLAMPNTGMAVTTDIGAVYDIHPRNKQEVGKRLALWALARTYGKQNQAYSGPIYRKMQIEGDRIRVSFAHADDGLVQRGDTFTDIEIAGADEIFFPAQAQIDGNSLLVFSDQVAQPAAVRLGFSNTATPNLFNRAGLPASPFRTDEWPIVIENVKVTSTFDADNQRLTVALSSANTASAIFYTLDGSDPTLASFWYSSPIQLTQSARVRARVFQDQRPSLSLASVDFIRHAALGKSVRQAIPYSPKYPAGGDLTLVNGLHGSNNFRDGQWLGFEGEDIIAVIDLGATVPIHKISTRFLQNVNSWIWLPEWIALAVSEDGQNFQNLSTLEHQIAEQAKGAFVQDFSLETVDVRTRFIRVQAKNRSVCPAWHPGAGGKAWIFADEIVIE